MIKIVLEHLKDSLATLNNHSVYAELKKVEDIKIFMESHVFAVWDFMSLLKALQCSSTCVSVPWIPVQQSKTARFVNEIVLEEETDVDVTGNPKSHFEMYLDAMQEVGGNTSRIKSFLKECPTDIDLMFSYIEGIPYLSGAEKSFLKFTFSIIQCNAPHKVAAAFTFGREDIIPEMFMNLLQQSSATEHFPKLTFYLKRHIELDGDEHGPLALEMINELCGSDEQKWDEVIAIGKEAIDQRILLWDGIHEKLRLHKCTQNQAVNV
ncbi:DUF3050 domain-containing protein [Croceivirga thetidis]|uniref:DUF3050 domain-containing protein n=1 Tax=Croceivirga thetidis TaxID=2721623 RepID=A0ABX1GMC3_9FLAO|nr:DUF3050 domain-containing protein [Croceivirga thetidis]NKI31072.1 DUF3050 domain-containing protein [Croceivirga thetidis]